MGASISPPALIVRFMLGESKEKLDVGPGAQRPPVPEFPSCWLLQMQPLTGPPRVPASAAEEALSGSRWVGASSEAPPGMWPGLGPGFLLFSASLAPVGSICPCPESGALETDAVGRVKGKGALSWPPAPTSALGRPDAVHWQPLCTPTVNWESLP